MNSYQDLRNELSKLTSGAAAQPAVAINNHLGQIIQEEESLNDMLWSPEESAEIYPTSILDWALWCAARGLAVLPCKERDKLPENKLVLHAVNSSSNDPETIKAWFAKMPGCNYAIAGGQSDLAFYDYDELYEDDTNIDFPKELRSTFQVRSGRELKPGQIGGIHYYTRGACTSRSLFADPVLPIVRRQGVDKSGNLLVDDAGNPVMQNFDAHDRLVNDRNRVTVGELRSRGQYVIGPGGHHKSGRAYTIINDAPLVENPNRNDEKKRVVVPIGTDEQTRCADEIQAGLDAAKINFRGPFAYGESSFKWLVDCPWKHEHTGGKDLDDGDSSSAVFMDAAGVAGYACQHSHCKGVRQRKELLGWIENAVGHEVAFGNKPPEAPKIHFYIDGVLAGSPEHIERLKQSGIYNNTDSNNFSNEEEYEENESSFQSRITELYHQGKTVEEIAEESGFNKLVTESLAKVAAETAKAEAVRKEAEEEIKNNWLSKFRGVTEMEEGDIVMVIDGVLQEGTCFIGANPGDGKTLIALAMAKAISSGTPLFNVENFSVKEARPVIYLIPESRDRAFRKRCESFRITTDKMKFMARTISSGAPLELGDPYLLEAVRQLKPVVFLDTASRFMKSNDENNAAQNRMLVNDVTSLLAAGAVCVVILHHATKASKNEAMDLQNMLRGTSDLAAMCDSTFGIRKDESLHNNGAGPLEIEIKNLKDREMTGELTTLRLAASYKKDGIAFPVSYINETGNFRVIGEDLIRRTAVAIIRVIALEPNIPAKELASRLGTSEYQVKKTLASQGFHKVAGGPGGSSPWHQDWDKPCPYAKPTEADLLQDTIKWLRDRLTTGATGESIQGLREAEVLTRADMAGFKEKVLKQAAKRLGVKIDRKTRIWSRSENDAPAGMIVE